jgi:WD40 repeat protein
VTLASLNEKGTLVAVYAGKATAVASVASGEILASSENIESRPQSIAVDDGASVLVGATDGKVYRWRYNEEMSGDGRDLTFERYIGHSSVITSVAFHPLGRLLLSGDWVGQVNVWLRYDKDDFGGAYDRNRYPGRFYTDVPTKAKGSQLSDAVESIVVSTSGERFVTATRDGSLQVWLIRGLKKLGEVKAHDGSITSVALSEDGSRVASSGRDGSVRTWKVVENEDIKGASIAALEAVGEAVLPDQKKLQWGLDGQLLGARGDTVSVIAVSRVTPVPTP